MSLRKITSLTALLAFLALALTSVFSFLAPRGPGSSQWEAMGMNKHDWFTLHTNLGILFLITSIIHIVFNIKPIIAYLKNKDQKFILFSMNFNISLIITLWIILGSIFSWPPINKIQELKNSLGNRGRHHQEAVVVEEKKTELKQLPEKPPLFYSGRSLNRLANTYEMDVPRIIKKLEEIGIQSQADWTFKQIGESNDMDPRSVYDAILQVQQ